ncbi:Helicase-related_protein [Hexamita inflata]|uniref:Helicase-related protein n=1 Tax=Hexamita inflata TaxID=28002 RepID=A0AA86UGZ0_9EUKA|nr:Helicase-related protein [Hexamita inflata]
MLQKQLQEGEMQIKLGSGIEHNGKFISFFLQSRKLRETATNLLLRTGELKAHFNKDFKFSNRCNQVGTPGIDQLLYSCNRCNHKWCSECGEWHKSGEKCVNIGNHKRCPNCKIYFEKLDKTTCNHIECALQTKKHSLSLAIQNETITVSPGPGSYDQPLKTNQGFTIGKTDRSYYDIFRPKQITPDFAPQKQFEIKPVKIATYRFKAERNDNPGPYDTRSAYEYLHPKKQLSIQEAGFRTVTGAAEGIQKQLSAQQVKLQKQLVEQLKAELEIGRKTLGIGMEGKKMSREERKQLNEASACFKTFNTANEYEIHFAMAGPGYEGLVHGRIITMKLFPHNFPKVIIDHEHFKQPVISNELLKTWHPQMGTYVLLQQVADQFRVLNAVNADLVVVDASISKQFVCKTCGCRNEEWVAKLLKNRQK